MFNFKPVSSPFLFTTPRIAIVSVVNDLATDHRVQKTCFVLKELGYEVVLFGRRLPKSLPVPDWPFRAKRIKLLFNRGPLFYLFFNLRLFFYLLFKKADLLYANDLDTLPANYLASKLKNTALVYDSHELFCDVPELMNTPFKRKIWQSLEALLLPKLKFCITVNESIARIFNEKYGTSFISVRNIPALEDHILPKQKEACGVSENTSVLILQGAGINMDRGAEELVQSMQYVDSAVLFIIGSGDHWQKLIDLCQSLNLGDKVRFIPKLPRRDLLSYTLMADLGLSLDKNTNPNYYYSLPNKLFDYIQCGVPVLASRLPEIENILNNYRVGTFIETHEPRHIAQKINTLLGSSELCEFRKNTLEARKILNWQNEQHKLKSLIAGISRSL